MLLLPQVFIQSLDGFLHDSNRERTHLWDAWKERCKEVGLRDAELEAHYECEGLHNVYETLKEIFKPLIERDGSLLPELKTHWRRILQVRNDDTELSSGQSVRESQYSIPATWLEGVDVDCEDDEKVNEEEKHDEDGDVDMEQSVSQDVLDIPMLGDIPISAAGSQPTENKMHFLNLSDVDLNNENLLEERKNALQGLDDFVHSHQQFLYTREKFVPSHIRSASMIDEMIDMVGLEGIHSLSDVWTQHDAFPWMRNVRQLRDRPDLVDEFDVVLDHLYRLWDTLNQFVGLFGEVFGCCWEWTRKGGVLKISGGKSEHLQNPLSYMKSWYGL